MLMFQRPTNGSNSAGGVEAAVSVTRRGSSCRPAAFEILTLSTKGKSQTIGMQALLDLMWEQTLASYISHRNPGWRGDYEKLETGSKSPTTAQHLDKIARRKTVRGNCTP
jgi:hypothetical protein